jgi:hypothetical protein
MGKWLCGVAAVLFLQGCADEEAQRSFRFEVVQVAGEEGNARTPFVFDDGCYLQVAWSEDRGEGPDLYLRGFDPEGNAAGEPRRVTESHWARRPVVVRVDRALVIAWSDRVGGMMEVMAAGLNPRGGDALAAVNVAASDVYASHSPRLIEFGGRPVLVYKERLMLTSVHSFKVVELDLQGRPQAEPLPLLDIVVVPYNPALATDGRTLMIASNSFSSAKWSLAFSPLRSLKKAPDFFQPIESEANLWAPDIAALGGDFLVAYRNNGGSTPAIEIARVDAEGQLFAAARTVGGGYDFVSGPTIASDGDSAVVLFRAEKFGRVDLVGVPVGPRGVPAGAEILQEGIELGDPVSAIKLGDSLCVAYESLAEGLGSVHLGCFRAPGGGS